jgi:hypothetical protein
MKRLLLLTLSTIFTLSISAQTVIFEDDFESYNLGDYIGEQSDLWKTWSANGEGTPADALVTDEWSLDGDHSIEIRQTVLGNDADVDLMMDIVEFQGDLEIAFDILVPSGNGAYWNMQGAGAVAVSWAMDMFFDPAGTFVVEQTAVEFLAGTYIPDEWTSIVINCDLDADEATVSVNGVESGVMPFDQYIFGGINFFGGGILTGDVLYFVDGVTITDLAPVNVEETEAFDFAVYPTPANDQLNIVSNAQGAAQVSVINLAGQVVFTENYNSLTQRQINVSDLTEGLYFVQVTSGDSYVTKKIMVKH